MPQVPEGHLATQTYLYIPGKTGQAAAEPLPWESETSENPRASPLPGYKLPGTPSWWGHTQPRNCVSHVPGQVPWDLLPHSALRLCSRNVQELQKHTNAALPFLLPCRNTALTFSLLQARAVPGQRGCQAAPQLSWGSALGSRRSRKRSAAQCLG